MEFHITILLASHFHFEVTLCIQVLAVPLLRITNERHASLLSAPSRLRLAAVTMFEARSLRDMVEVSGFSYLQYCIYVS